MASAPRAPKNNPPMIGLVSDLARLKISFARQVPRAAPGEAVSRPSDLFRLSAGLVGSVL